MRPLFTASAAVYCLVGCAHPLVNNAEDQDVEKRQGQTVAKIIADDEAQKSLPRFLREEKITCAIFAEAVNHYVDMGEEKAIESLRALANSKPLDSWADPALTRMALTCRALFQPKGKEPLRAPGPGGLINLPFKSMPIEKWPLYPVAHKGSSYFVLSEAYVIAGLPEPAIHYLDYCLKNGKFRKGRVPRPTKSQALRDFESLVNSEVWKSLEWESEFRDHLRAKGRVLEYLKAQAERIPDE